jgi:hypothetical protein
LAEGLFQPGHQVVQHLRGRQRQCGRGCCGGVSGHKRLGLDTAALHRLALAEVESLGRHRQPASAGDRAGKLQVVTDA